MAYAYGSADILRNDNNYKILFDLIWFFDFLLYDAYTKSTIAFWRGKRRLPDWWLPYLTAFPLLKLVRNFKSLKFFTQAQFLPALYFTLYRLQMIVDF